LKFKKLPEFSKEEDSGENRRFSKEKETKRVSQRILKEEKTLERRGRSERSKKPRRKRKEKEEEGEKRRS
jgi:hypothetical protein